MSRRALYRSLRRAAWLRSMIRIVDTSGAIRFADLGSSLGVQFPWNDADPDEPAEGDAWQRDDREEMRIRLGSKNYTLLASVLLAFYDDTSLQDAARAVQLGTAGTPWQAAQGFDPLYSEQVGTVLCYVRKVGSPTDGLRASIWSDDGSGKPLAKLGESAAVDGAEMGTSFAWLRFTFAVPVSVNNGTAYHVVLTRTSGGDVTNYYEWGVDASSPTYSDGQVSHRETDAGAWTAESGEDALFQVWSPGAGAASGGGGTADEKVRVSVNDSLSDYLLNKLAAGVAITLTEINDGSDEDAQIAHATDASAIPSAHHAKTADNEVYGLVQAGLESAKPAAGTAGRLWYSTDVDKLWRDTGSVWELVAVINLADMTARAHADLSDAPVDAHHTEAHADAQHTDGPNEKTANKGVANGYAGLDTSADVPRAQLPAAVAYEDEDNEFTGDLYINAEGKALIVDAANFKRVGFVKQNGYNPEIRYLSSIGLIFRRVTTGTLQAPTASDVPFQIEAGGDLAVNQNILMQPEKTVDGVVVSRHAARHLDANDPLVGGAQEANTTPTNIQAKWANQSGNARQVLLWDAANARVGWGYINAVDVKTPAQIATMYVRTVAHTQSGLALIGLSYTDTPQFLLSYDPNNPTALSIDIASHSYGGGRNPEINAGDYPDTTWTDYARAWESSQAINAGEVIGESVTFEATATVDGQSVTKQVTLTYHNLRLWGVSTNAAIDTDAEIDTFQTAQSSEISTTRVKTFTVTAGAGEYIYYIIPNRFGTPTFKVGGFEGGFQKVGSLVSYSNPRGFTENYDVWRSDESNLGQTTVEVT